MSKRPRAPQPSPLDAGAGGGPFFYDPPLPLIPPLEASLSLLVRGPLPQGCSARGLLSRLALADAAQAQSPASAACRAARLQAAYASSRALEAARSEAAESLEAAAAAHARRAGEAAAAAAGALLQPGEELSRDAAASAAEAAAVALREYGLHSASARAQGVVQHGEGGEAAAAALPPPALAADPSRLYAGRPLRGATSAVAYLGAEREAGAPPPHGRDAWRFPIDASAASGALDPHLVLGAREVLRRPAWPDRLHPRLLASAGRQHTRSLALAAQYDAAAEEEEGILALEARALGAAVRGGGGARMPG
jgi:hypothetical protein